MVLRSIGNNSLWALLSRQAPIETASQRFTAVAANRETAHALGVKRGAPLLFSELVGLSDNQPVDFTHVYYRPDHVFFTASLTSVAGDRRLPTGARNGPAIRTPERNGGTRPVAGGAKGRQRPA